MSDLDFTMGVGTAGQPNSQVNVRNKSIQNVVSGSAGYKQNDQLGATLRYASFIKEFDNADNQLGAGEAVQLLTENANSAINQVVSATLIIHDGLGANSEYSLGLATLDVSQRSILDIAQRANPSVNLSHEGLPLIKDKRDASGNVVTDFVYDEEYFIATESAVPTTPATQIVKAIDMINYNPSALTPETVIAFFNQGSAPITQGKIELRLLFV